MKTLSALLLILLLGLQYSLWVGHGGLAEIWRLTQAVRVQQEENRTLRERNLALDAEVRDLKQGTAAIEERARSELGMIGKGETFYQLVGE
ncbi:MAG: cell division protein FtsB [Gammaproteobacteria bacterium]|nr:cell division protein FtsB [Gammaproteobacteria bacterium]